MLDFVKTQGLWSSFHQKGLTAPWWRKAGGWEKCPPVLRGYARTSVLLRRKRKEIEREEEWEMCEERSYYNPLKAKQLQP